MKKIILYISILFSISSFGQKIKTIDLKADFGKFDGGFCLYDVNNDQYIKYNAGHCKKRFSPCSTFKIPNSLIGLETGVIPDTGFVIPFNSKLHPRNAYMLSTEPFKHWYEDLSLKRAFKYSCVWYYQELARQVGQERMKKMVDLLNYGNKDISSGLDSFWLCGSMQISIDEQIEFLKKFYLHQLKDISDKNINAVKEVMLYETAPSYKFYGKTGSGNCLNNMSIGWYVGFVETTSGTKIFAMNLIVRNLGDLKNNYQIELTKKILKELQVIK
ncbi:MAG: penicillin-binding transpeptidase domain-containing protein [Bacteroidota bacterium]|nr:penicillin-binding transpeptidase domain-containing protein [Bacteroidota bacterium]